MKRALAAGLLLGVLLLSPTPVEASHSGVTNWLSHPSGSVYCSSARFTGGSGTISGWIQYPFNQGPYRPKNSTSTGCLSDGSWDNYGYSVTH